MPRGWARLVQRTRGDALRDVREVAGAVVASAVVAGAGLEGESVNPSEIPDELVELLDDRAGKKHSREGSVMTTLAEILTRWEQIRRERIRAESRRNPSMYEQTLADLRAEVGHLREQHDAALKVVEAAEAWRDGIPGWTGERLTSVQALEAAVDEWRASRGL